MILIKFLIFILYLSQIKTELAADLPVDEDFVFVLNSKNFDNFINNNDFTVVFFYAPWCGHCVSMKPFYHEAAKALREDENIKSDKPVVLAKVDATLEQELASRFEIQGYPTLKIFRKGVSYEYEGPRRDAKAIIDYLVKESSNDWKPPESKVVVLTNSNFTDWVNKHELSLVEFYASYCVHCKKLAPNYEKAAKILSELAEPIPLAKIDSIQENNLSNQYDIKGFPTILVFKKGRYFEYNGGRSVDDIVQTMIKISKSRSIEVKNLNSFTINVERPTDVHVLGLFENKNNDLFELYNHFASKYSEDLKVYHSFNTQDFLKSFPKVKLPSILVYYHDLAVAKNQPKYRTFGKQEATIEDLENFVFRDSLPLVGYLNSKNKNLIYDKLKPICYVFYEVDFELKSHIKFIRDKVAFVASKYSQVRFALVNETDNFELVQKFHLEASENEFNLVCVNEKSKFFILNQDTDEFDQDEIVEFMNKFLNNKLTPFIKSEVEPKDNNKKNVKKLVGKTIENELKKQTGDVLLAFVGHDHYENLSLFESNLNQLALKFKNVYTAKINMFKNDYPEEFRPTNAHPSLYFVPSSDKSNPVECKDTNTFESMKQFLQENLDKSLNNKTNEKNEL